MSVHHVKLPDVGEGVAEAELISWLVQVGDTVTTESALAEVMTDKATVEISSPVAGTVAALHGVPGDVLAVGATFVEVDLGDSGAAPIAAPVASAPAAEPGAPADPPPATQPPDSAPDAAPVTHGARAGRAIAAPAVRARAQALGIDLATVAGSGPDGRVLHADLDRHLVGTSGTRPATLAPATGMGTEQVMGLRRRIAEHLTTSWHEIPHITYVDAVDASELEALRAALNRRSDGAGPRLTILPFLVRAIVLACAEQPRFSATYDAATRLLTTSEAVHVGIATQTPDGLMVPVVRHAEALGLWELAGEIGSVAEAARNGTATREQLSGSTITITSLGALGGLVTTPIINHPEVAIIGVNRMETRPVWRDGTFVPRQLFNLSSSFDHRIIDGWDAATFVQRVKELLELPALLFVDDQH